MKKSIFNFILTCYLFVAWTYDDGVYAIKKYRHKRKIKRILRDNKDIAELSKLAGIDEQN